MNKRRLIKRIIELLIIIIAFILTIKSIQYATLTRGYIGFGGEYMISVITIVVIALIED